MSQPKKSPREIRDEAEKIKANVQESVQKKGNFLEESPRITPQFAQECLNLMLTGQDSPLTYAECFEALKNAEPESMEEVSGSEFLHFEDDVTYDMLVYGIEEKVIKGKKMTVVLMRDENGVPFISGAAVLVNAVREHSQFLPDFFKITCRGKLTSAQGDYYDLQILRFKH